MGTQYLRKDDLIASGLGAVAFQGYGITRYATTSIGASRFLLPNSNNKNLNSLNLEAFFGVQPTIIPLAISLGSANRTVTMSTLVDLNPSISLGSANRTIAMSRLIDVNLSVSLGSANRTVTMGVSAGFVLPLSISLGSANRTIVTSTLVAVPVPASLGSANRTMTAAVAINLLRSISLGSANRTVTMSRLIDVNLSVSLGSANRAVTMGSLVKPSPAISLGSANRAVTMGTLIALAHSITYPRNSFISMAVNPNVPLPLLVPWTGTITMSETIDSGGGSNPQVDGSVAKVTGYSLTLVVTTNPTILLEHGMSLGMTVTIIIPVSLNLDKTISLREVRIPERIVSLGPFREEDQSYIDRLSPAELLEIRGIPPNST